MSFVASPREGRIFTANDLERAALAVLEERLVAYGNAVARQAGDATPPEPPRSYTCSATFDRWAEDQVPAIVVASPGTVEAPELRGDSYSGLFDLLVGVYVSAATELATHEIVRLWTAAIRACIVQTPSLRGVTSSATFLGESYDVVDIRDRRTYIAGTCAFAVRVDEIVSVTAGPLLATDPPDLEPWTTVETHEETIERLPEESVA